MGGWSFPSLLLPFSFLSDALVWCWYGQGWLGGSQEKK